MHSHSTRETDFFFFLFTFMLKTKSGALLKPLDLNTKEMLCRCLNILGPDPKSIKSMGVSPLSSTSTRAEPENSRPSAAWLYEYLNWKG